MNPDDIIPYTSDDSAAAARLLVDLAKPAPAPSDALVEAARALLAAMDAKLASDHAWKYIAPWAELTALRAALPPERKPVLNPMCAWPFPEKKP